MHGREDIGRHARPDHRRQVGRRQAGQLDAVAPRPCGPAGRRTARGGRRSDPCGRCTPRPGAPDPPARRAGRAGRATRRRPTAGRRAPAASRVAALASRSATAAHELQRARPRPEAGKPASAATPPSPGRSGSARNSCCHTQYGTSRAAWSARPHASSKPAELARRATARASVVFPTPASPSITHNDPCPSTADSSASSSCRIVASRPTSVPPSGSRAGRAAAGPPDTAIGGVPVGVDGAPATIPPSGPASVAAPPPMARIVPQDLAVQASVTPGRGRRRVRRPAAGAPSRTLRAPRPGVRCDRGLASAARGRSRAAARRRSTPGCSRPRGPAWPVTSNASTCSSRTERSMSVRRPTSCSTTGPA